jgi:hypothetical protein
VKTLITVYRAVEQNRHLATFAQDQIKYEAISHQSSLLNGNMQCDGLWGNHFINPWNVNQNAWCECYSWHIALSGQHPPIGAATHASRTWKSSTVQFTAAFIQTAFHNELPRLEHFCLMGLILWCPNSCAQHSPRRKVVHVLRWKMAG